MNKKIHVLSYGFRSPNSSAFLFPLIVFAKELKQAGYALRFFEELSEDLTQCDALMIEHKSILERYELAHALEIIGELAAKTRLIWCDQSDSSGTFSGQILPCVHKYLKSQILADKSGYMRRYYGDRIYTDYYHEKYGVSDDVQYDYAPVTDEKDLEKIGVSWNSGLMNHGFFGPYLNRLRDKAGGLIPLFYAGKMGDPLAPRPQDLSCRMGISYKRATARFQRELMAQKLAGRLPTDKLSRCAYFGELKSSKICVSPFGFGEITLKDFEAFLCGSMLLKPDMDHMTTWPRFFEKDVTYAAHDWDLGNLEETIEKCLADEPKRTAIAQEGQARYLKYTRGKEAGALFTRHFKTLIA